MNLKYLSMVVLLAASLTSFAQSVDQYVSSFSQTGPVNDFSNKLNEVEEEGLAALIDSLQSASEVKYALCLIDALNGHPIRRVATELGNQWALGKTNGDKGVLILISEEEKEAFIATGIGLRGQLANKEVQSIVDNFLLPELKNRHYRKALSTSLIQIQQRVNNNTEQGFSVPPYIIVILLLVLIGFLAYDYFKLGGFDPKMWRFARGRKGLLGGSDGYVSDSSDPFGGDGAGGSFGGDGGGGGDD